MKVSKMENFVLSKTGVKVFKDYRDNITIDKDTPALRKKALYFKEKYPKGNVKGLSRLGSKNSEDAKSWNLFRSLQLESRMHSYYSSIGIKDELENVLFWGLHCNTAEFDKTLKSTLDIIEPPNLWHIQQTEPDVIIMGKKIVIFNESKLGRANANIDAWNRKAPFSKKHDLYRKNARPYFKKCFIDDFSVEGRRYYQLMRNYIVGTHFAERVKKEFHLVALVSADNKAKNNLSHEQEFKNFCGSLKDGKNCHLLVWNQFY